MKIVFRVDSSAQMGSGHLMRCLTLANELRKQGVSVCFVSRLHRGHLIHKLEEAKHLVYKLPEPSDSTSALSGYEAWLGVSVVQDYNETLSALDGQHYDWLIVDHYGLDKVWESALRINANKIMVIDDLADRAHDCDVLLDQNYFGSETCLRYSEYVSVSTDLLLGPKYALLQPEYAELRSLSVPSDGVVNRVLVFLGNSDWDNQTGAVLEALSCPELSHLLVDVVVGSNHPNLKALEKQVSGKKQVILHYDLPTLAGLMMRSDLVIGAGGATTWERMCLGRPSIAICIAENQQQFSQKLAADGYQILLADKDADISVTCSQVITHVLNEPDKLRQMSKLSYQLLDGFGAQRVASILLGSVVIDKPAKLCINILSDEDTWLLSAIHELRKAWLTEGFQVNWVYKPADLREGDICFMLGCSRIVNPKQMALNHHNLVVHESALPEGRGWSPMTWQILEGKHEICVTLFEATADLDAGPIYAQQRIILDGTELVETWREKQARATQTLCLDWVKAFPKSSQNPISQHGEVSYYPRRKAHDSELNPKKTIEEQFNLLRVVDNEKYPAFFYLHGKQYRLLIECIE